MPTVIEFGIGIILIVIAWKLFKGVVKLVVIGGIILLAILVLSGKIHLGVMGF